MVHKCGLDHYDTIGDGVAVLIPESLVGCARFLENLEKMSRIEIGKENGMESFVVVFDGVNSGLREKAHLGTSYDEEGSRMAHIIADIINENVSAKAKFPSSEGSMTALMEEVGELAKAYLDEPRENIYNEAVQVASMVIRVALEGDPTLEDYRKKRGSED